MSCITPRWPIFDLYPQHAERLRAQCLAWGVPAEACDAIVEDLMLTLGCVLDEQPDLDAAAWMERDVRRRAKTVLWGLGLPMPDDRPRRGWWPRWFR